MAILRISQTFTSDQIADLIYKYAAVDQSFTITGFEEVSHNKFVDLKYWRDTPEFKQVFYRKKSEIELQPKADLVWFKLRNMADRRQIKFRSKLVERDQVPSRIIWRIK